MPGRQLPPEILAYLGPCRQPDTLVEKVVEQCGLAKFTGDAGLTDFDPLVVVMHLVTEEVLGLCRSFQKKAARSAWCEALRTIQSGGSLEHNSFIPCRRCDQAFEPVVDEELLRLFLTWYRKQTIEALLAIHLCPSCGGSIRAERQKTYCGDMHTPEPRSIADDEEWAYQLLKHSDL